MTKAKLIDGVCERYPSLTQPQVEVLVNAVFDTIEESLAKGDRIEIRGFGSFHLRHRKMRDGHNPKTGATVRVPAKDVPFFKVGKELKELVDQGDLSA